MPTPSGSGPTSASTANRWAFSPATGGGMMPRGKKERGRPVTRRRPPRIAAMPEQIAAALFRRPANHQGQFERDRGGGMPLRRLPAETPLPGNALQRRPARELPPARARRGQWICPCVNRYIIPKIIAFRGYAREALSNRLDTSSGRRLLSFLTILAGKEASLKELYSGSGPLSGLYRDISKRTLYRDLDHLKENDLIKVEGDVIEARVDLMSQFTA